MAKKPAKKKPMRPKVKDVMVPGQGGARMIQGVTDALKKARKKKR